ncbi:cytosolic carboxypeptidase 6 [Phlebotomus argentipes]|uniref:cytosolic carboxypeptidase 6 n=1 Tax=Phlebotomus argentipes TaxID=94469 RepID=UPI0028933BA9|nr:cytosolic carboxypeptidase 6 [Phlebotomus argentipes]
MDDSEDSDGEGGLGNVSRVVIRPPGHSGKAKRGHLCFDAAFETGNLGRADLVGEFEYDLFLRPDTCNPRYRFWFNFTVDNVKQDQRVIFNVVNINKKRNLFKDGMTPLVKSSGRPKWQRLSKSLVFFYKSPMHQNNYVLSFSFAFDREDEVYQFALAPPYSYSRLQSYLSVLETKFPEHRFQRTTLCHSLQNRKLELLTIDHVEKPDKVDSKNKLRVIFILARTHSGESPTSFVIQGLIEFLIGNHPIAQILRSNFIFKIIPMVNPDGVFLGNNRCNLIGQDMNRTWHVATEYSHPTLWATKKLFKEFDQSDCYQIDFVIDLHAHANLLGSFMYGNTYEDVYRYERHLVFPKILSTNAGDWISENMMFNADDKKTGSVRRFCCEKLSDNVNAYSLEVSMCGFFLKGTQTMTQYTDDGYMRLGRNLARTFLEYYRFINVLPVPLTSEVRSKRGRPKTHCARARSRIRREVQTRPKTTRTYAPISYKDLSVCYDSDTSYEGSPIRNNYHGYGFGTRSTGNIYLNQDQFSLLHIQSSKFNTLDFSNELRPRASTKSPPRIRTAFNKNDDNVTLPPKPYLTIIDFNQLTRGGLEQAAKTKTSSIDLPKVRSSSKNRLPSKL